MNLSHFPILYPFAAGLLVACSVSSETNASEDLEVSVGETIEIASSSGYCYFPTVHRFQNGEIFATIRMSADDTIPESEFSAYSISTDGGKTWGSRYTIGGSAAVDAAYSYNPLNDGSIMVLGTGFSTVEPYPAGQASQFHIAITKYSRGGRDVTVMRDAVLRLSDPAKGTPVKRPGEMKRDRTFEVVPWAQSSRGMRTTSWPQHTLWPRETRNTDALFSCGLRIWDERGLSTRRLRRSSPARIRRPGGETRGRMKRRSFARRTIVCSRFSARGTAVQILARRAPPMAERPGARLNRQA